jgi:hypothetical protein
LLALLAVPIITATMTDKPPTRIVRFDIRAIPKKPPAPSVRRRLLGEAALAILVWDTIDFVAGS